MDEIVSFVLGSAENPVQMAVYFMFFILLFCIVLVCSCSNTTNISNGEQVFIDIFDNTYYLKGEKLDYIQSIGFYGCEIHYPYLFLNLYPINYL